MCVCVRQSLSVCERQSLSVGVQSHRLAIMYYYNEGQHPTILQEGHTGQNVRINSAYRVHIHCMHTAIALRRIAA